MKELVEYIIKSIVTQPDKVNITQENSSDGLLLKLEVAPEDKGRVIGRQGRVAQALRTLLRVKAAKENTKVRLEIL
jgi:predicted RNA-binding protein YlqC (UPF0109 family)